MPAWFYLPSFIAGLLTMLAAYLANNGPALSSADLAAINQYCSNGGCF